MWDEGAVRRFAADNHGLVDRQVLLAHGATNDVIKAHVAAGRWVQVQWGVYYLNVTQQTWLNRDPCRASSRRSALSCIPPDCRRPMAPRWHHHPTDRADSSIRESGPPQPSHPAPHATSPSKCRGGGCSGMHGRENSARSLRASHRSGHREDVYECSPPEADLSR